MTLAFASFEFQAPDGSAIAGTAESIPGTCAGTFTDSDPAAPNGFEHGGGTDIDWNGQVSGSIMGATVFADEDGGLWLAHHLIPADADPLSSETLELIQAEFRLGQALEAAEALDSMIKESPPLIPMMRAEYGAAASIAARLRTSYDRAKTAALAAMRVELEEQAEPAPLPEIPETWPVQPIEPDSIEGIAAAARRDLCTCGTCGRSWDDGKVTGMTPTPAGRCPFEQFHPEA